MKRLSEIWQEVFSDPRCYVEDVILSYKAKKGDVFLTQAGEDIASVVYAPRSEFSFFDDQLPIAYIMGVATVPSLRGRAHMTRLMAHTLKTLHDEEVAFASLIPADEWLYDYYERFGFYRAFCLKSEEICPKAGLCSADVRDVTDTDELYSFYKEFFDDSQFCLKKTKTDIQAVVKDHLLGAGRIRAVYEKERICALAFSIFTDECVIKELLSPDPALKDVLIRDAAKLYGCKKVKLISRPGDTEREGVYFRGMLRAVRVFDVLSAYAKSNPEESFSISVKDDHIPDNTGEYRIQKCRCEKLSDIVGCDAVSPGKLVERLLCGRRCYMNLMLD